MIVGFYYGRRSGVTCLPFANHRIPWIPPVPAPFGALAGAPPRRPLLAARRFSSVVAAASDFAAGATSYFGVDQTVPLGTPGALEGSGSPASTNLSSAVGDLLVATVAVDNGSTLTPTACQAERWNAGPATVTGAGATIPADASPVPMSWDLSGPPV